MQHFRLIIEFNVRDCYTLSLNRPHMNVTQRELNEVDGSALEEVDQVTSSSPHLCGQSLQFCAIELRWSARHARLSLRKTSSRSIQIVKPFPLTSEKDR